MNWRNKILGILVLLAAPPVHAAITAASALPSPQLVALDRSSSISVTWSATTALGPYIRSSQGRFRTADGAFTFGAINTLLSKTVPAGASATFSETVLVPDSVVQAALRRGYSSLVYLRSFEDGDGPGLGMDASVELRITSGAAAGFSVSRIALAFDDGTPVRLVAPKESVRAQAELSFNGSGLLRAAWEVAEPATTLGEPIFRTLQLVRQPLLGASPVRIVSPLLPATSSGPYQLRLRITEPLPGFDAPVIRYFVGEAGAAAPSLYLYGPNHGELLGPDTRFRWAAIKGAKSYMLLLFAQPHNAQTVLPELGDAPAAPTQSDIAAAQSRPPASGMLVPGQQTDASLTVAVKARLKSGNAYLWQVLAIGEDGALIGESALRQIRSP